MRLDIRLPIGLLFAALGSLLGAFGLFGNRSIYQRSLGININLAWGAALLIFGVIMLTFGYRGGKTRRREQCPQAVARRP